jgi:hypothetical protein
MTVEIRPIEGMRRKAARESSEMDAESCAVPSIESAGAPLSCGYRMLPIHGQP